MIVQQALGNAHLFSRRIFDGSETTGSNDVSAFIDAPQGHWTLADARPELKKHPALLDVTAWPVRMAFFTPDGETGAPDYESTMVLQSNGIVRTMQIDYGDFSVTGTLKSVEPLPAPAC